VSENLLSERYGVGKSRRRDKVLAIVVASLATIGFLVWAVFFTISDANRVTTRDVGFNVNNEYSTEVVFEVSRNPGQTVVCDVQVLNESFSIVGFKTIDVAPSGRRSVVISTVVNTTELGTSGLVAECR
jgi:hypothetical protein